MSKYYIYKMNILDNPLYFGSYIGQHKIGKKEPMKDGYNGSGSDWKKYILSQKIPVEKEILCMCESVEEANEMEQFYIEQYKNDGIYLWNRYKGGGAHDCGRIYTEEELAEHRKETVKQWNRKWYKTHKEHKKQYDKQYRKANKEHIAERTKQYRKAHKEHSKQIWKQYYETNKEKLAEHQKQYNRQLCQYNGEILTFNALTKRFRRTGITKPTAEAKKYLIEQEVA